MANNLDLFHRLSAIVSGLMPADDAIWQPTMVERRWRACTRGRHGQYQNGVTKHRTGTKHRSFRNLFLQIS